jgi:hypothetical protein
MGKKEKERENLFGKKSIQPRLSYFAFIGTWIYQSSGDVWRVGLLHKLPLKVTLISAWGAEFSDVAHAVFIAFVVNATTLFYVIHV